MATSETAGAPCATCGAPVAYDLERRADVHLADGDVTGLSPDVAARHRKDASITAEEELTDRMDDDTAAAQQRASEADAAAQEWIAAQRAAVDRAQNSWIRRQLVAIMVSITFTMGFGLGAVYGTLNGPGWLVAPISLAVSGWFFLMMRDRPPR